jgi:hypothetical protein
MLTMERIHAAETLLREARETRQQTEREIIADMRAYDNQTLMTRIQINRDNETLARRIVFDARREFRLDFEATAPRYGQ